ncbi:hypothetical protein DIPPA_22379 [Diplonema papillatum]|nr:hypothetical protein DIPPA_22379 [Diplonema papillatum]
MVASGAKGAREPPGFFKDGEEGVTVPPRVAVRVTNSQFGARRSVELVATENVEAGAVLLEEPPLLVWGETVAQPPAAASDAEKVLYQRCAAVRKLSETMKAAGKYCDEVLPVVQAYCAAKCDRRFDSSSVWATPWQISDSNSTMEEVKLRTGFCVLAHKGLSKTIHEKAFNDPVAELSRLCSIAERAALPTPSGSAVCRYTSCAKRVPFVKPKLVSVGCRPGVKKNKEPAAPTPNADYHVVVVDSESDERSCGYRWKVVLKARRPIAFGDVISIPLDKKPAQFFSDDDAKAAFLRAAGSAGSDRKLAEDVLRDPKKLKDAVLHQAKQRTAGDVVSSFAKGQHPVLPPARPPVGHLEKIGVRTVANELWKEELIGSGRAVAAQSKRYLCLVDHTFDRSECAQIAGAWARAGRPSAVPFHVGFESSARVLGTAHVATVMRHLFQRAAKLLPPTYRGLPLTGVAAQGTYLSLGAGEELCEFNMRLRIEEGQAAIPFALMLSDNGGSLTFPKNDQSIPFKCGRIVLWTEELAHCIPPSTAQRDIFLACLMYQARPTTQSNNERGEIA